MEDREDVGPARLDVGGLAVHHVGHAPHHHVPHAPRLSDHANRTKDNMRTLRKVTTPPTLRGFRKLSINHGII